MSSIDRLVVSDGRKVGARRDLNGVFLLDSILQGAGNDDLVLEFPMSEVGTSFLTSSYVDADIGAGTVKEVRYRKGEKT